MDTTESLRCIFRRALTAVLTGSALTGCSSGPGPGIETEPGFVPVICEGGTPRWLANLTPEPAVDSMVLIGEFGSPVLDQFGEPCASAVDRVGCETKLAGLLNTDGFPFGQAIQASNTAFLHATRGDDAIAVGIHPSLVEFLRPIDTHAEAVLLVQASDYNVPCGRGGSREAEAGFEVQAFRQVGCDGRDRYLIRVGRDGSVSEVSRVTEQEADPGCIVGRRPAGLRPPSRRQDLSSVGGYLANAAMLERASVDAFVRLHEELGAHGAPRELQDRARSAAHDEVRHARLVARLARRFGGRAWVPRVRAVGVRDLETIALENATEGCVRETFGSLVGQWQSLHASDPAVRRIYRRLAEDELRHAALAWSVAQWVEPLLSDRVRHRLSVARHDAVLTLDAELAVEPSPEVRRVAGVPSARPARALARHLFGCLEVKASAVGRTDESV